MANDKVAIWNQTLKLGRSPANGELLIGNGVDFTLANITAGSGATVTNTAGGIQISATGSGGTVTAVTASSPLASSGGNTPDISLSGIIGVANGGTGLATLTANYVLLGNGTSSLQLVAPGTSGNILTSNGTTWTSSPSTGFKLSRMAADVSFTSSTTYGDLTGLSFSVDANSNYVFTTYIYSTFAAAGAHKITATVPTGATLTAGGFADINSSGGPAITAGIITTSGADLFSYTYTSATSDFVQVQGFVSTSSTAGTVQIRGAQQASSGTATVFKAGSWIQYAKVS